MARIPRNRPQQRSPLPPGRGPSAGGDARGAVRAVSPRPPLRHCAQPWRQRCAIRAQTPGTGWPPCRSGVPRYTVHTLSTALHRTGDSHLRRYRVERSGCPDFLVTGAVRRTGDAVAAWSYHLVRGIRHQNHAARAVVVADALRGNGALSARSSAVAGYVVCVGTAKAADHYREAQPPRGPACLLCGCARRQRLAGICGG